MKANSNIVGCFFLLAAAACCLNASPVLVIGTPGDSLLSKPTGPSPSLGVLYNFDSLPSNTTFNPNTYASSGVTISSPDGLLVLPYSTQSSPNELFDNSSNGTADITISLTRGTNEIGIGIADSDPVTITLQALAAGDVDLGTPFNVTIPELLPNPGNAYFAIADTSPDIYGLEILQSTGNANYSGLAIDDLQLAPEPASLGSMGLGAVVLISAFLRRRNK